jgi:hypothetical protein
MTGHISGEVSSIIRFPFFLLDLICTRRHTPDHRLNLAHVSVVPIRRRICPRGRSLLVLPDKAKIRNLWPRREFRLATVVPFPYTCFFHFGGCATVAQWQSTGFVNQGLWVQLPPVASRGKPTTQGIGGWVRRLAPSARFGLSFRTHHRGHFAAGCEECRATLSW